ncbi:MAG TPA: CapA family protein [Dehalococcoidia bacterium]|nr:CapA family protein [Dehalococcoidia bacterium]
MRLMLPAVVFVLLLAASCGGNGGDPEETEPLVNPPVGETIGPTSTPRGETPLPATPTPNLPPELTLEDIFPPRDLSQYVLDPARVRTLIATGDVIPARYTDFIIRQQGDNFLYTVEATADIVSDADLTVVNLEAPLISYCEVHTEGFTFCGRPGFTAALNAAGADVVTMENNHIGNYGGPGIEETRGHLEAAGMQWADRSTPAIVDVRGMKFGFLAFNGVIEVIDREAMVAAIEALRPQVDVLAVAYHWGAEYVSLPTTAAGVANDHPVEIGHLAVDAGADFVIGNHPHWVQGVELYKGKFIAYAHGNYIFDQMWSYETRVGVIGKYTFYDDVLIGVEYVPTLIENYAQPVPMTGEERQRTLDGMRDASFELRALLAQP